MEDMALAKHWLVGLSVLGLMIGCSSEDKGGSCEDGFSNSCDNLLGGGINNGGGAATSGGAATNGGGAATSGGGLAGASGFIDPANDLCANAQASASGLIPRVHLLLDGSCSMSTPYPSQPGQMSATQCTNDQNTRWGALRNALVGQGGIVPQLEGSVAFGASVFGTNPSCPIAIDGPLPAVGNAAAITNAMPQRPPGNFTPAGKALDWVYNNVYAGGTTDPDSLAGPQIIVFATDGEPNATDDACESTMTDYGPSENAVMLAAQAGVTTYVISLAASSGEFHDHLQRLASGF